jgi:hypothetical protein
MPTLREGASGAGGFTPIPSGGEKHAPSAAAASTAINAIVVVFIDIPFLFLGFLKGNLEKESVSPGGLTRFLRKYILRGRL